MLLAIDVGNTQTVFALFEGEELCGQWRMATQPGRTADEYAVFLMQWMERQGVSMGHVQAAIGSAVVPDAIFALKTLTKRYFKTELTLVGDPEVQLDMQVEIERPRELGADRLVNAYAAWQKYHCALMVLDFGTATTFDVVNGKGAYVGGVIAPGIRLSLEALHRAAAKLPHIAVERPEKVIGTSTVSAMRSGIYYGYLGLIEGFITRIQEEQGEHMKVIATGGLAPLYAGATTLVDDVDGDLTIQGLRMIYTKICNGL